MVLSQWFSDCVHQNDLENLLKHRLVTLTCRVFDLVLWIRDWEFAFFTSLWVMPVPTGDGPSLPLKCVAKLISRQNQCFVSKRWGVWGQCEVSCCPFLSHRAAFLLDVLTHQSVVVTVSCTEFIISSKLYADGTTFMAESEEELKRL